MQKRDIKPLLEYLKSRSDPKLRAIALEVILYGFKRITPFKEARNRSIFYGPAEQHWSEETVPSLDDITLVDVESILPKDETLSLDEITLVDIDQRTVRGVE